MHKESSFRVNRYLSKITHAKGRAVLVEQWLEEEDSTTDIKTILAIGKAFQEMVESAVDLLAMLLKDCSSPPLDDYTNINQAMELGVLPDTMGPLLREANGLRNRLIHMYNDVETGILLESIKRLLPGLVSYLEVIRNWIEKKSPK